MLTKKKKSRFFNKQMALVIFIIGIMIFSIGGFLLSSNPPSQTVRYGTYSFVRDGNLWITRINKLPVPFHFLPGDVSDLNISRDALNLLKNSRMVYTTFDPAIEDLSVIELARFEMREDFPNFFNIYVSDGVMTEDETYNLPLITCDNATTFVPVISFVEKNTTNVYAEEECVIIEGKGSDFLRVKDRIMYSLLGIMD